MQTNLLARVCNDVECTSLINFYDVLHNLFVINYSREEYRNLFYSSHMKCTTLKLNTDSNP